jgi:dihydrofolate reductase
MRNIALIAAVDEQWTIGKAGALPWHIPEDLAHFKRLTLNQTVLMGRKTFDSIGRALPKRRNLVLSRDTQLSIPGVECVHSIEQALSMTSERLWVIGGEEIYRLFLPYADAIELTRVGLSIEGGDAHFPQIPANFCCIAQLDGQHPAPRIKFESWRRV